MAYIQRWEKDLSGKGGQYVYDYWPSSEDYDSFFILAPFVRIARYVLRLSVSKRIIIVLWVMIKGMFRALSFLCVMVFIPVFRYAKKEIVALFKGRGGNSQRPQYKKFADTKTEYGIRIR